MKKLEVNVHHLTRVEGHGNIKVRAADGKIEELKLEIVESPRFFESMLVGRYIDEVPHITARICGICALGHTTASVRAAENALGWEAPEEVMWLRRLLMDGETLQSHILHVCFLVAPDFFNVGSVIPLASTHPEVVKMALRLKKAANEMCDILVGRKIHPVSMAPGGFTYWPTRKDLRRVKELLEGARPDLDETVRLFAGLEPPALDSPAEYVGLRSEGDRYEFVQGRVTSTTGESVEEGDYLKFLTERTVDHSTARHAATKRGNYAVGALARYKLNHDRLTPWAADAAKKLRLAPKTTNPFDNNAAQVVESLQAVDEGIEMLDRLFKVKNPPVFKPLGKRAGKGVAAVEVPRGILFHQYETNDEGVVVNANCVIPTAQNQANIEMDLHRFVPALLAKGKNQDEITRACEMLVRAYDPCISCSVHFLEVEVV
ncbi:MAG: Ni/Fe hydrogenase subunit alpha [Candidatus Eisenbacteria bacterium]